jgi:hypothetical protein
VCLFVCMFVCLFVCMFVCLCVCFVCLRRLSFVLNVASFSVLSIFDCPFRIL